MVDIRRKQLVVFDLDGTLAESKAIMDAEMSDLLVRLLRIRKVAVIGGGAYHKFEEQFIKAFACPEELKSKLFLFPTTASRFYRYDKGWHEVYADLLTDAERAQIMNAFHQAYQDIDYHDPEVLYGEVIEDRGTQVTFSALGQEAPLAAKQAWRHGPLDRRVELKAALDKYLPNFEVAIPGYTSIDITRKGVDKGFGIRKIEEILHIPIPEMVFVGDALYEGGNDYPAKRSGVDCIAISGPQEVKELIRSWLEVLNDPAK